MGNDENLMAFRGLEMTRELGAQYSPLKSSYYEAVYIDSIMRKNGMEVALMTGERGTEYSFYQIPDESVDILHVASHAYYTPEIDNNSSASLQEWMLSHTGLVLSGANNGCDFSKDDGHLTAYEISQTNLSSIIRRQNNVGMKRIIIFLLWTITAEITKTQKRFCLCITLGVIHRKKLQPFLI